MEYKKILLIMCIFMLVLAPVMAKEISDIDKQLLLDKPDLRTIEPKQVVITDRLDESYIVKEDGVYFKQLKQTNPVVWIDKKVGEIYHVDSTRDFIENETITLEFYYDIQPDSIAHYTHSGKFDRYYFPTQWKWTSDCDGVGENAICSGGWVTFEVFNIEEGTGSSTFPISVSGPTWANDGEFYGEFMNNTYLSLENSANEIWNGTNDISVSMFFKSNCISSESCYLFSNPVFGTLGNRFMIIINSSGTGITSTRGNITSSISPILLNNWYNVFVSSNFTDFDFYGFVY